GSGKSTLLNQLAGLEKPTMGKVYIGQTNISLLTEDQLAGFRQKNIGFVFQSYNLLPSMSAIENVAMPMLFRGTPKELREKEAITMLKKVGLGSRMRHKPSEMSGGQQQRVGIARAFVAHPKIVFADEPTGNLDSRTTIEVMRLLVSMSHQYGITFVLVTHDNELASYADRIITIKDGALVSDRINPKPAYLLSDEDVEKRLALPDTELTSKHLTACGAVSPRG
ncbi:MAG: ABC transporter ATP-binding protein, partial [Oscillospiraceae bacterium]